jgi:hypothetical protein
MHCKTVIYKKMTIDFQELDPMNKQGNTDKLKLF